jgi:uncharacterized protein YjbI with pentapeptide repeats
MVDVHQQNGRPKSSPGSTKALVTGLPLGRPSKSKNRKFDWQAVTVTISVISVVLLGVGQCSTDRRAEQGQDADRFIRAIDQIGQEGPEKLSIRLGGIYALSRLMHDSTRMAPTVIEVLCAFARTHSPIPEVLPAKAPLPSADVEAALAELNSRPSPSDQDHSLDLNRIMLSHERLGGYNLSSSNMNHANLASANMSDANLADADLTGADLRGANLAGIDMNTAIVGGYEGRIGGKVSGMRTRGPYLGGANLEGAVLSNADLRGASLNGVDLKGAIMLNTLLGADLRFADLSGADLRGADMRASDLRGADLRGAIGLDFHRMAGAKTDSETLLPSYFQPAPPEPVPTGAPS